jgi:putative membrane protein
MSKTGMVVAAGFVFVVLAVALAWLVLVTPGWGMMNGTWMSGMMGSYGMPGYGYGTPYMLGWPVLGALVVGAGVLAMLWFVRQTGPGPLAISGHEPALDVLKLRFAKGEISKEQFEEMGHIINA